MEEISLGRINLLRHHPDGSLDFSHWRVTFSFDLYVPSYNVELNTHLIVGPDENFSLFSYEGALRTWHKFLDFVPSNEVSNIEVSYEAVGSIVILARLDTSVATTITCL